MDNQLEVSLLKWTLRYFVSEKRYRIMRKSDIWDNIKNHKLDKLFDELGWIYLRATSSRRKTIEKIVRMIPYLSWQLVLYVRRSAVRLLFDNNIVRYGLSVGLLISHREDPRDVVMSFLILMVGFEKAGINFEEWTNKFVLENSFNSVDLSFFRDVQNKPDDWKKYALEKFGPPSWN